MTTYYVSPTGDDSNIGQGPGDGDAWETIGKANVTLTAGDTVYIRAGTYTETINPSNSGSIGNRITYENYTGEEPNITSSSIYGAIINSSKNYITLKGLKMDNGSQSGHNMEIFVKAINADYLTVEDCTFKYLYYEQGNSWDYGIVADANSDYAHIKNNDVRYCGSTDLSGTTNYGDGIQLNGDYGLAEDNYVDYCGHQDIVTNGDYNIVRDNTFKGTWGRTHNDHGDHNVWDGNTFYDVRENDAVSEPHHAIQFEDSDYVIFRRNTIYDVGGVGVHLYADESTDFGRFYHNVIYNAGRDQVALYNEIMILEESGSSDWITDWVFRNNIFYNCESDGIEYWGGTYSDSGDFDFNYNHWEDDNSGEWNGLNDAYGDPKFVDAENDDFNLAADSPCIDTGGWLTLTNGTSSGVPSTTLIVDDATFFCDGYGIVTGDTIQLQGQTATAVITNISSNTITLATTLTWGDGVGVALEYTGTAPDMGVYEYGEAGVPFVCYNSFKAKIMDGTIDLENHTIKCALVSSGYTPDIDTHDEWADVSGQEVSGTGYTAGGKALENKAVTADATDDEGVFDADNTTWSTSTITASYAILYDDTATSDDLIGYIDFLEDKISISDDFAIQWNSEGIINLG